ncbi:hypothetical protein [Thermodesulfobium sp.]
MKRFVSLSLICLIFLLFLSSISFADKATLLSQKEITNRLSLYLPLNRILDTYLVRDSNANKYYIVVSVDENNKTHLDLFSPVGDGIIFKNLDHIVLDYQNPNFKLFNLGTDQSALLIWERMGSGAFLSYDVFLVRDERLVNIAQGKAIFQGDIKTFDGGFELTSSDKRWFYVWDKDQFEKNLEGDFLSYPDNFVSNVSSIDSNTVLITYRVGEGEISWLSSSDVDLKVGEKLLLRRLNPLEDSTCRILYNDENLSYEGNGLFKAKRSGKAVITLVPNGYDWGKAKTITIVISAS